MHPIEQLRYVARAAGADAGLLVQEAASALSVFASEPAGLVTACRRILSRQPGVGPLWWMASHMVTAADPRAAARAVIDELRHDPTARELAHELPDGATVLIVGWPDLVLQALPRRGDVQVLVLDVEGQGAGVVRRLERADVLAEDIDPGRVAGAVEEADLVIIEAAALGASMALVDVGNLTAAAVARATSTPVWLVAGVGRRLPEPYWQSIVERVTDPDELPWLSSHEFVSLALVDRVVTPGGVRLPDELGAPDCPMAGELLKELI